MKSMLWKELRENWKWSVLGFLFLLLAEFYSLSAARRAEDYRDLTLCGSGFLLSSAFGCAAIGAGLAVIQILPELRRDQWAALLHRPVSRSVVFAGKVLGGLLLYFCATALPFLLSVAFVAAPGQFAAPLVPGMLRPGLSDIAFGPVIYFAALLLCLHRGRWFGSRGAICLAIVPMFFLHLTIGWPFLLPLLCILCLSLAAWGAMLGNGRVDTYLRMGWVAYLFVVLAGLETALLLLTLGLDLLPSRQVTPPGSYTYFRITQDNQIFHATTKFDGTAFTGQVLTDLQGKVVTDARYTGNNSSGEFCQTLFLAWELGQESSPSESYVAGQPRNALNFVEELTNYQGQEEWFQLVRQNYLVGFNKLSRRCIGLFDADGFKAAGANPRPFARPLHGGYSYSSDSRWFWSGSRVYGVDFSQRSTIRIDVPGEVIYGVTRMASYAEDQSAFVGVALTRVVRIYDAQGTPICSIPYPHSPDVWSSISIATNLAADRFYLQSEPGFLWTRTQKRIATNEPTFLDEVDRDGRILHTYSLPANNVALAPPSWTIRSYFLTSPFLAYAAAILSQGESFSPTTADTGLRPVSDALRSAHAHPAGEGLLLVIALAWGIVAWLWARRGDLSAKRAGLWSVFVFCFGLPGLLAFRLTEDWPRRVPCPYCGRKRPINTEQCPSCHQPWQSAPATGAEIFEHSAAA